jgi:hypothetical protein
MHNSLRAFLSVAVGAALTCSAGAQQLPTHWEDLTSAEFVQALQQSNSTCLLPFVDQNRSGSGDMVRRHRKEHVIWGVPACRAKDARDLHFSGGTIERNPVTLDRRFAGLGESPEMPCYLDASAEQEATWGMCRGIAPYEKLRIGRTNAYNGRRRLRCKLQLKPRN